MFLLFNPPPLSSNLRLFFFTLLLVSSSLAYYLLNYSCYLLTYLSSPITYPLLFLLELSRGVCKLNNGRTKCIHILPLSIPNFAAYPQLISLYESNSPIGKVLRL
jgi:hypothetical protein